MLNNYRNHFRYHFCLHLIKGMDIGGYWQSSMGNYQTYAQFWNILLYFDYDFKDHSNSFGFQRNFRLKKSGPSFMISIHQIYIKSQLVIVQKFKSLIEMNEKIMDKLYTQNLELGNRINSLSDQNNFYKIQINNFNKLTNSINKDLYKLGINFQNKEIIEDSAKIGPLFVISNKIKLKNLQLKIGNSIRHTQKFKKNLEGSLPFITKQIQAIQQQVSILVAKYMQIKQQNALLRNINHGENLSFVFRSFKQQAKKIKNKKEVSMVQLQNRKKQTIKKFQYVKKEQKQKSRTLSQLICFNDILGEQVRKLRSLYPENIQLNHMRAQQAKQLQDLQEQQKTLLNQISVYQKQLQQQYLINKDCKQRINDKKYQENKQIKVLEEQVLKCREQLRQFKLKYRKIRTSGLKSVKEN